MIFSTTPTEATRGTHPAGFTLVEVMIAAALSTFVLAGVLSSFLMLGRNGVTIANYSESEAQIRRAIETFSEDVRMADSINWNSPPPGALSVTLGFPHSTGKYSADSYKVTYYGVLVANHPETSFFYRRPGDATSTVTPTKLLSGLSSFSFARFNRLDAAAANNTETKRLQITMNVRKTGQTLVAANTTVVSASFTLRNKVAN